MLYRRIPPIPEFWVDDPEEEKKRPSSLNFMPDTGEPYVSMDLKDPLDPDEKAQEARTLSHPDARPGSGLFEIDVEVLREFRLKVTYEPAYGERHFGVSGWEQMTTKDAVRARKKLSRRTRIKKEPDIPRRTTEEKT